MKVTRYSGPRLGTLVASIGGDPTAPSGSDPAPDCCDVAADPVDRAIDAAAVRLSAAGAVTLVQSMFDGTGGDSGIFSASYDSAPTAGNILIIIMGGRADPNPLNVPSGFTSLVQNTFAAVDSYNHRIVAKVSDGTETTITFDNTSNGAPETIIMSEWTGFGGVLPTVDTSATSDVTDDATPAIPAITPTSSISALLIASVWKKAAGPNPGPSTLSGYTLLDDSAYIGLGNRHRLTAWYQVVGTTSGTYGPTDISSTGDGTDDSNVIHFATETSPDEAAWVIPSPNVTDGDDATYDTVTSNTDLLRIDLGAPFRITSTRIRIAANTSGSRTFTIKGANAVDFSDEVTLATIAFTATGSYTAQDVTGSWSTTEEYQYFELTIGTSDTYRIHAWELFEGTLVGDVTAVSDALDAHLADTVDAHDASAVSIVDAGGYFTGTDVEAALQELGAGGGSGLGWFNVTNYGATGDGTTDDTSAVNSAIAALNAAGRGVLYFPAGTYKATSALTSITVPATVLGDGAGLSGSGGSTVTCTSNTAALFTVGTNGITFRGLRLLNTGGSESAGSAIAVVTGAGTACRYEDLWVEGFYDGLSLIYGFQWAMDNCEITNPVRYGVRIANVDLPDGGDWSMSNTWFGTRSRNATAAIRQESAGGGKLVNVKINQNTVADQSTYGGVKRFTTGHHVYIDGATNSTSVLTYAGVSIENVSGDAVHLQTNGTGVFHLATINGLQVGLYSNNTGRAVKVSAAAAGGLGTDGALVGVVIDGCVFRTDGTARAAIELTNTDRVTLGDIQLVQNFTSRYTSSGDTNTTDGVSLSYAGTGDIADVAATEGAGAATTVARGDHVHALGITTTRGDLIRRGASANERVALGTSGQVLTSDGTDAVWGNAVDAVGGHYEVIVSGSAPPVAVTNEAEDDWLYGWVPD